MKKPSTKVVKALSVKVRGILKDEGVKMPHGYQVAIRKRAFKKK